MKSSCLRKPLSSDNGSKAGFEPQAEVVERGALGAFLVSLALALGGFAILRGPYIFWNVEGTGVVPSGTYLTLLAAALGCLGGAIQFVTKSRRYFSLAGFAAALPLIFFSDWLCLRYSFLQAPSVRGELICAFLLSLLLLRVRRLGFFFCWTLLASILLFHGFFSEAAGRLIFSDDHASVFYRLTLLQSQFPAIPFYSPMWNAGTDARDFFSTGIINLYLIGYPLIAFFKLEQVYNVLVATELFVVLPLSVFAAARLLQRDSLSSSLAAALSMATSLTWYRWALKYGSMGFVTSATLLPINFALAVRILDEEREVSAIEALVFVATFSLMLLWTPTGLAFLPVVAAALMRFRTHIRRRYIAAILIALFVLNLPWIAIWMRVANVYRFVATPSAGTEQNRESAFRTDEEIESRASESAPASKHDRRKGKGKSREISASTVLQSLRHFAVNSNPILLFLGIPGLFLFAGRSRRLFTAMTLWLIALGAVLAPIKPQLELERMLVILGLLLSIPAGSAVAELLQTAAFGRPRLSLQLLASFAAAFILTGAASASAIVRNRTLDTYAFSDEVVSSMAEAISRYANNSRVLFSGFVLHELDKGHLAPLAYFTGKPLVASSPVHNTWWYTDVIPEYYRDAGPAEVENFFNYMNAGIVMAHEPFWRHYFASQPSVYKLLWEGGRFKMYRRLSNVNTYFLKGAGLMLEQRTDGVVLRVDGPEAVVKFRYFPFLEASNCEIAPYSLPGELELIELKNCPVGSRVEIRARTGLHRVFG